MRLHFFKSLKIAAVMRLFVLCMLVNGLAGIVCSPAHAVIYYVKKSATGLNNGTSWGNAFTDLKYAISTALDGDQIWVAAGTYSPLPSPGDSFFISKNVEIYGGFIGLTETLLTERDWKTNITILDGAGLNEHVVTYNAGSSSAVLDGFTIKGGYGSGQQGGGLINNGQSPTIRHCIFTGNSALQGAGIYNSGGSPTIENCTFSANSATGAGGGIFNQSSNPTIIGCTFSNNSSDSEGAGIYNQNSGLSIRGCTFSGNISYSSGGGLYNINSPGTAINNCTFSANRSSTAGGGGIFNATGSMNITNSTFIGNTASGNGGAIFNTGTLSFSNTIAADSSSPTDVYNLSPGTLTSDYNIVEFMFGYPSGANDIIGDQPSLGIASLADNGGPTQTHALLSGSVAIDAGNPGFTAPPDYDQRGTGFPRVNKCRVDIGAYESNLGPNIQVINDGGTEIVSGTGSVDYGTASVGTPISKIFTVKNMDVGSMNLTVSNLTVPSGFTVVSTFSPGNVLSPSLSATFEIRMDAVSTGPFTGTVRFDTTDYCKNPFTFTVQGTVIAPGLPEIDISQNGTAIACGGTYDFGNTLLNTSSVPVVFTISNTGTADLNLNGTPSKISISGTNPSEFSVDETALVSPVAGSGSATFSVTFSPSGLGGKTASIFIPNNDPDEYACSVNLTGAGVINSPPAILNLDGDIALYANLPLPLDTGNDAAVSDPDNTDFSNGYLYVEISGGTADDSLEISNDADGDGNSATGIFSDMYGIVYYNNVSIGYIVSGLGNTILKVLFDSDNANPAVISQLIRAVRYKSAVTQTGTKSVFFKVYDGTDYSSPATVTVSFGSLYKLTVSISGSGSVSGSGISCPSDCYEHFPADQIVSLTAYPYSGYTLSGWSGVLGSSGNSASVKMDSDKTVTVIFAGGSSPYPYPDDLCPNDPNKIDPGICGCGVADTDTDRDGTADCKDMCPNNPHKMQPGICGCGEPDTDTDEDGTLDCKDSCPNDPHKTQPGICGCSISDADADGDGMADCKDLCPNDPYKTQPGICGCGVPDADTDEDGVADCKDNCPNDPDKTEPGFCGCNVSDKDADGNGSPDCINNKEPNPPKPLDAENKIYPPGPITLKTAPYSDAEGDAHTETLWVVYRIDNSCGENVVEHVSATDLTQYTVTGLLAGLKYGWKVGFRDSGSGKVAWSEEGTFIVGENVTGSTVRSNPGTQVSDYRMFSFPYWRDNPEAEKILSEIIGENYDTRYFRIGTYDPRTGQYIEYGPDLEFEPGRAYWFLTRNGMDIPQFGSPVSTGQDINIRLLFDPLTGNGWNMVGAPNTADYLWLDVEIVVGSMCQSIRIADLPEENPYISKKLWQWSKEGYSGDAHRLEKGMGYWVKVKQGGLWLRFRADKQLLLSDAQTSGAQMLNGTGTRIWKSLTPNPAHANEEESPPMPPGGFAESRTGSDSGGGGCFIRTAFGQYEYGIK